MSKKSPISNLNSSFFFRDTSIHKFFIKCWNGKKVAWNIIRTHAIDLCMEICQKVAGKFKIKNGTDIWWLLIKKEQIL